MLISETFVNLDREVRYSEVPPYEPFTDDLGELYRSLRAEYGRCTGHVYIDRADAQPLAVGWVFVKRVPYDDCNKTYLREVWITCYQTIETTTKREYLGVQK
jgi:hypothetical protein